MFQLAALRKESGLKRSELARELGTNQNTLANYEKELRQAPYNTLIEIANYFDVTVDELLGRDGRAVFVSKFSTVQKRDAEHLNPVKRLNEKNSERLYDYINLLLSSQNY